MSDPRGRDDRAEIDDKPRRAANRVTTPEPAVGDGRGRGDGDATALARRLAAAQAEISELRSRISQKDEELASHDDEFGKMLARVAEVEARSKALQKHINEIEPLQRDAEAHAEELARELEDTRAALREVTRRTEQLQSGNEDVERLMEELAAANRRLATERSAAEEAEQSLALEREQTDALHLKLAVEREQNEAMRLKLADLEIFQVEVEELRDEVRGLEDKVAARERELGEERAAKSRLASEASSAAGMHDEIESLREALMARGAEIHGLLDKNNELGARADELAAAVEEERATSARRGAELGSLREELERTSSRAALVKADLDVTIQELEAERLERRALEQKLAEERAARAAELQSLTEERDRALTDHATLALARDALASDLAVAVAAREAAAATSAGLEAARAALATDLGAMTEARDAAQGAAELGEKARVELVAERDALQNEVATLRTQLEERDATIHAQIAEGEHKDALRAGLDRTVAALTLERDALSARAAELDGRVGFLEQQRIADEELLASKISAVTQILDEIEERDASQMRSRAQSFFAIRSMFLSGEVANVEAPPPVARPQGLRETEETQTWRAELPSTQPEGGERPRSQRPTAPDPSEEPTRVRAAVLLTPEEAAEVNRSVLSQGDPEDVEDITGAVVVDEETEERSETLPAT